MTDATAGTAPGTHGAPAGWTAPPARAVRLHAGWLALLFAAIALAVQAASLLAWDRGDGWQAPALAALLAVAAAMLGGVIGARLRHQRWRLDEEGLWLRQGRLWTRETRVPASRVQHVDLKHGPLERRARLATLVVHTAAAQLSGITVRGLDAADALQLRDALARQLDDAGDAL